MPDNPDFRQFVQPGFSLIELLVAMAIGMLLLLGVSYIYLGSKDTYRMEENLARMQESGRLAFDYLARDIRAAGDFGCISKNASAATVSAGETCGSWPTDIKLKPLVCTLGNGNCTGTTAGTLNFDPAKAIFGYESSGPTDLAPPIAAATDSIVVTGSTPTAASISADDDGSLTLTTVSGLKVGDALIAANCRIAVVFEACTVTSAPTASVSHSSGDTCTSFTNACTNWNPSVFGILNGGSILKASRNIYYIRGASLYRRDIKNVESELVPNIENLQITYGLAGSVDGPPTSYVTAANVTDWSLVKSVHIEALVRSPDDNLTSTGQPYYFNGSDLVAADRRLRLTMETTIGIRNRTLASTQ